MLLWLSRLVILLSTIEVAVAHAERRSRYYSRGGAHSYQRAEPSSSLPGSRPTPQPYIQGSIVYAPKEYQSSSLPPGYQIAKDSHYRADSAIDHGPTVSSGQHQYSAQGYYRVTREGTAIQTGQSAFSGGKANYYRTDGRSDLQAKIDALESLAALQNRALAQYMHAVANWASQVRAEVAVFRSAHARGELVLSPTQIYLLDFQESRLGMLLDSARGYASPDLSVRQKTIDQLKAIMGQVHAEYTRCYREGKLDYANWSAMDRGYRDFVRRADYARAH